MESAVITQKKPDIKQLFSSQKKYQHIVKQTTTEERVDKLRKLKSAILKYKDDIVQAIHSDIGKPHFEILNHEIMLVLVEIDHVCTQLAGWMKPTLVQSTLNPAAKIKVIHEPRGVILMISPWNFPWLLTISPLVAAISAGNCAVIKPSELAPETSSLLARFISEVFDKREVSVVEGDVDVAQDLLALPFDHIFFTGSAKIGKIVMQAAAKNLASITLELGGKNPAIIDRDVDLPKAASIIMKGKCVNAGQSCIALDYLLIPADMKDEFVQLAKETIRKAYYSEDGSFNHNDYSLIINKANFNRIQRLIIDAVTLGAKVVCGGRMDEEKRFIEPTILVDVPLESEIMKEEIFGPVLPICTYISLEEAVEFIRKTDKPLAFYIFSNNSNNIEYLLSHSTSGGACINDVLLQYLELTLPFGGVNGSGFGAYHGIYGFRELSHARSVFFQPAETPLDTFNVPPYENKIKVLEQMLVKMNEK